MSFSGKHIPKMFSQKRLFVSECILTLIIFVRAVRNQNQGYVSRKCIPWKRFAEVYSVKKIRGSVFREKSLSRLVGMLYLHIFLIKMHEIDTATEVYLSPLRSKSMDWFLYDNGLRHERVKTLSNIYDWGFFARIVNSICPLTRVKALSQKTGMVLNMPVSHTDFRDIMILW